VSRRKINKNKVVGLPVDLQALIIYIFHIQQLTNQRKPFLRDTSHSTFRPLVLEFLCQLQNIFHYGGSEGYEIRKYENKNKNQYGRQVVNTACKRDYVAHQQIFIIS
jgi:hypothetical protein